MRLDARLFAAALFIAPTLSLADPLAQRGLEDSVKRGPEMTDAMIDERKKALDRVLARRNEDTAKEYNELVALEAKLKQERLDFEKKQISDRKAFLDNLRKEADLKKRASAYGKFSSEQQNARRKFVNAQNARRDDANSNHRQSRMVRHDDVPVKPSAASAARPAATKAGSKKN